MFLFMKKKIRNRNLLKGKFMPLFLCFIILMFALINYFEYKNYKKMDFEAKKIIYDIKKEKNKKMELEKEMNMCQAKNYIEKRARRELGFIKSNEIIFCVDKNFKENKKSNVDGDSVE